MPTSNQRPLGEKAGRGEISCGLENLIRPDSDLVQISVPKLDMTAIKFVRQTYENKRFSHGK